MDHLLVRLENIRQALESKGSKKTTAMEEPSRVGSAGRLVTIASTGGIGAKPEELLKLPAIPNHSWSISWGHSHNLARNLG